MRKRDRAVSLICVLSSRPEFPTVELRVIPNQFLIATHDALANGIRGDTNEVRLTRTDSHLH